MSLYFLGNLIEQSFTYNDTDQLKSFQPCLNEILHGFPFIFLIHFILIFLSHCAQESRDRRILLISKPDYNLRLLDEPTTAELLGTFPAFDVPPGQRKSSSPVQGGGFHERNTWHFKKLRKSLWGCHSLFRLREQTKKRFFNFFHVNLYASAEDAARWQNHPAKNCDCNMGINPISQWP